MADAVAADPSTLCKNFRFLRENNPNDFSLYHVQGMTCSSPNSLAANEANDQVGFPAAGILVLLSPRTGEQKYIQTPSLSQNIACVTFSKDGRLIAFIENGLRPYLSVWFVREAKPVNYFQVGNSGKLCFHPHKPFIVLIGSLLKDISVYNYIQGAKVAYSRWTTTPLSMCVPHDGKCVIVSGHRKITYFSLQGVDSMARSINTSIIESKRSFALGRLSEHTFIDIICGKRKHRKGLYAVTAAGYVCKLKIDIIEKYEKIDSSLTCVAYGLDLLFVGCPDSVVKICSPDSLAVVASLSLSESIGPGMYPNIKPLANVETCGIVVSDRYKIITGVFSDSSIYSWQVVHSPGDGVKCSFIVPSDYKHCGSDDKEDSDSLGNQLHRAALIRQFVCATSPSLMREMCHGFWAPPQPQGDPKVLGCNVNAVRITPDGREIISGDENGSINVQDAGTGATRRVIEAHMSQVTYVEIMYDEDYKMICTGGRDRVIFILDAADDFSLVQVLCDHSAAITAVSLVRCSGTLTLVSAAADSVILIRTAVASARPQFQITGQVPCSLGKHTFTCTSQVLATGSRNGVIHLFQTDLIRVNEPELIIQDIKSGTMGDGLETLDIDPSSSFLAVGCSSGHTTLYHLQTGNVVTTLNNQRGLAQIKFTRDMQYMICHSFHRVGCALVWKLPVRMTEYMRYKAERKGETPSSKAKYDSFVKFLTDSETSFYRSSSSTPSIRSMNLLNRSHSSQDSGGDSYYEYDGDVRDCYPSSSDCSCSCTHSRIGCNYTTSDASIRINSMPNISIISMKDPSPSRPPSRRESRARKRSKYRLQRSNTCDNIKKSGSYVNRKLSRYNSDLSYVSNNSSDNEDVSTSSIDHKTGPFSIHHQSPTTYNSMGYNNTDDTDQQVLDYLNKHNSPTERSETEKNDLPLRKKLIPNSPPVPKGSNRNSPSFKPRERNESIVITNTQFDQAEIKQFNKVGNSLALENNTNIRSKTEKHSENKELGVSTLKNVDSITYSSTKGSPERSREEALKLLQTFAQETITENRRAGGDSVVEKPPQPDDLENTLTEKDSEKAKTLTISENTSKDVDEVKEECHDSRTEDIIRAMQHLLAMRRSEDALRNQDKVTVDTDNNVVIGLAPNLEKNRKGSVLVSGVKRSTENGDDHSLSGVFRQEKRSVGDSVPDSSKKDRLNNMGYEVISASELVTAPECEAPRENSSNSNLKNYQKAVRPKADMVKSSVKVARNESNETHEDSCSSESYTTCSAYTHSVGNSGTPTTPVGTPIGTPANTPSKTTSYPPSNTPTSSLSNLNNPSTHPPKKSLTKTPNSAHNVSKAAKERDSQQSQSQVSSFFKQDDYLKRLRDIRANFEKNIEALKRERQLTEKIPQD